MKIRIILILCFMYLYNCASDEGSDSDTNIPPEVEILIPDTNIELVKNEQLFISVSASDSDGEVDTVYVKFDGEVIAQLTSIPYEYTYDTFHLNIGSIHELTAVVSDNEGKLTTSETVLIEIIPPIQIPAEVQVLSPTFIGLFNIDVEIELISPGNVSFWNIGVCWNTTGQPVKDNNLNNFSSGSVSETFQSIKSGNLELGETYYFRAYVIGSLGINYSENEIIVQTAIDYNSGTGTFIDVRDGEEYNYVTINGQTWMAENLRYEECSEYEDPIDNMNYGRLPCYSCPEGWEVPTKDDYMQLVNYFGGTNQAGKYLKANNPEFWDISSATNESLFSALPGGYKHHFDNEDPVENDVGVKGYFRYSYIDDFTGLGYHGWLSVNSGIEVGLYDEEYGTNNYGVSMRCIQEQ